MPWIIAKWAQTLDGRIATRNGSSKWISSERSRRLVHRERGRVDAIFTGIGTVLVDDPMLTARNLHHPRRIAERVVIDDELQTPRSAQLVTTAEKVPTTIYCKAELVETPPAEQLRSVGVRIAAIPPEGGLRALIQAESLAQEWSTILVEAGGGLMGRLFKEHLINAALVFTSPRLMGDDAAPGPLRGFTPDSVDAAIGLDQMFNLQRKPDLISAFQIEETAR